MKPLVLIVWLCALAVQECICDFYPPFIWHWQNCVYRQLKETYGTNGTKEFFMKVLPYNGLNVVCPHRFMVNDWLQAQFPNAMYENMWLVDRRGYENCVVNDKTNPKHNKLILRCDDRRRIKYKLFKFHNKYNIEEPMFAPGHHYYFISTSKGIKKSHLDSKSGGHCKTHYMRLHIYVCDPKKEDCIWEMPRCSPPYDMMRSMTKFSRNNPQTRAPETVPPPSTNIPIVTTQERRSYVQATEKPTKSERAKTSVPEVVNRAKTSVPEVVNRDRNDHSPQNGPEAEKQCKEEEDKGTSVHLILNFVLGGVILFMAIVIVILACGLARKNANSGDGRPTSVAFSAMSQEPSAHLYEETGRFVHPPLTPLSKSPPQTPLTANPTFYLPPMTEIRPRSSSSRSGFNNTVYNKRRHSHDGSSSQVESSPMLSNNANVDPEPV